MCFDSVVPNIRGFVEHSTSQSNDPCVIDENVDAAEGAFHWGHRWGQCCSIRNVEPRDQCGPTDAFQLRKHKAILLLVTRQYSHGCTRSSQAQCNGAADSAIAAGHDGDTATQVKKGSVASHCAP